MYINFCNQRHWSVTFLRTQPTLSQSINFHNFKERKDSLGYRIHRTADAYRLVARYATAIFPRTCHLHFYRAVEIFWIIYIYIYTQYCLQTLSSLNNSDALHIYILPTPALCANSNAVTRKHSPSVHNYPYITFPHKTAIQGRKRFQANFSSKRTSDEVVIWSLPVAFKGNRVVNEQSEWQCKWRVIICQ
jgi:hypothetical protein